MSIRAHLMKKVKYEDVFFNLTHDNYFMRLLEEDSGLDSLNQDGAGELEISRDAVENIYHEIINNNHSSISKDEQNRTLEILENLRKEMDKQGDDYLEFSCF